MSKIELGKTYRTRDGREVRILMTDAGFMLTPILAAYADGNGMWWSQYYTRDGRVQNGRDDARDLIEVKPRIKREVWVNVYTYAIPELYFSREDADAETERGDVKGRIACIPITIDCEKGDGL